MDQTTRELRLSNRKAIIDSCQVRPNGQTARQWLTENNVPGKQYYYWLHSLRNQTCKEPNVSLLIAYEKDKRKS